MDIQWASVKIGSLESVFEEKPKGGEGSGLEQGRTREWEKISNTKRRKSAMGIHRQRGAGSIGEHMGLGGLIPLSADPPAKNIGGEKLV